MKASSNESFPYDKYRSNKHVKFMIEDSFSPKPNSNSPGKLADSKEPPKHAGLTKKGKGKSPASSLSSSKNSSIGSLPGHSFVQKAENVFAGSSLQSSQKPTENNPFSVSQSSTSEISSLTQSQVQAGMAKLTDLCPEDKARIGELMKRLAKEKEEKEKLRKELEDKEKHYGQTIEELEKEKEEVIKESSDLQSQFKYSIGLLKSFQELNNKSSIRVNNTNNLSFNESLLKAEKQYERSRSQSTHSVERENNTYENFPDHESPGQTRFSQERAYGNRNFDESDMSSFDRAKSALSNVDRQEKNSQDINRIQDDLEELANNLKKVSFSPSKSLLSKSMLTEKDFSTSQERKAPSPIKLVENYKSRDEFKDEDGFPLAAKKQVEAKPPRGRRDPLKGFSRIPPEFDAETSSDEDELAIAQKWLNLRKQKIQEINQQIQHERDHHQEDEEEEEEEEEEAPRFQTQTSASPPKKATFSPSPIKNASTASTQYQSNQYSRQIPIPQQMPSRSPVKSTKESPYSSASRNERVLIPQKYDRSTPQRTEQIPSNRQLSTAEKLKSVPVDINTLNPDEILELKKILEERLQIEQLKDKGEQLQRSAEKKLQKIEEILNSPENERYRSKSNSKSPIIKKSMEDTQGLPSTKPFFNSTKAFEPLDHLMKTQTNPNAQSKITLADSSIMKEFDSLTHSEFSTPLPYKTSTQNFKANNVGDLKGSGEDQQNFERLYEEKLKEFLRIRDRMIEANKLKTTNDINVEEILRSTLKGDGLKHLGIEETQRSERTIKLASPISVPTTIARSEMPTLHERDLMASELSKDKTSRTNSNLATLNSKNSPTRKMVQSDFMKPTPLVPARTISFSTEQPIRTEARAPQFEKEKENIDELVALVDDFYEDNLFDLVDDIEKKENRAPNLQINTANSFDKKVINTVKSPVFNSTKDSMSSIDDEFLNLKNSVQNMLSKEKPKPQPKMKEKADREDDKVNKKLLQKFERSDYILPTIPAVTEEEDTQRILEVREFDPRPYKESVLKQQSKQLYFSGKNDKSDSSFVETDQSVLFINKKVEELKKKQPKKTNAYGMRK